MRGSITRLLEGALLFAELEERFLGASESGETLAPGGFGIGFAGPQLVRILDANLGDELIDGQAAREADEVGAELFDLSAEQFPLIELSKDEIIEVRQPGGGDEL